MIVGLQIFIEKEEMVLDSNFWCGYPENIQNQCFFLTKASPILLPERLHFVSAFLFTGIMADELFLIFYFSINITACSPITG